jgi:predicted NAD/FAD-binding protein
MKIAIVGAGISGLGCAYALSKIPNLKITIYEGGSHIGGHSNTIDLTLNGITQGVDTGFLVFNHRTYPRLVRLFNELEVPIEKSEMSFSASIPGISDKNIEWAGTNLNSLFAQRKNIFKLSFLRMIWDIVKFNKLCTRLAVNNGLANLQLSVGEFIQQHGFSKEFRDWYFLPMIGAIWSCSVTQMLDFPIATMIRFCHNHGLIKIMDRPQWLTVKGGSRNYVERICSRLEKNGVEFIRRPVKSVSRLNSKVQIGCNSNTIEYDQVVFASHSDQTLNLLHEPSAAEKSILGAIKYQANRAVLHTDEKILPSNRNCWAAWNYSSKSTQTTHHVCVNYLINKLQPLPEEWKNHAVIVSLNPVIEPSPQKVCADIQYAHPIFDESAIAAQNNLPLIQGTNNTWFCGAWTGYGFHEDGLRSGELVAQAIEDLLLKREVRSLETA